MQNQEHLLQEIEGIDDYWGPTFRAIYDHDDDSHKFIETLDNRIKQYDKDIERMCNFYYQGFIDSIRELQQVENQASKLKKKVIELDVNIQNITADVVTAGEELVKARQVENNIKMAIDSLSLCLPALSSYSKLQKQMADKRYYPALKTLEQLEQLYLPQVSHYKFFRQMIDRIPKLRENIRESSMSDLNSFLETIRKFSSKVGEAAMKHSIEQQNYDFGLNKIKKKPYMDNSNEDNISDDEDLLSAQDLIDFSPVYRCIHICTVLSSRDIFDAYYRQQRREQALLTLHPPNNMHESIASYCIYLQSIVGFFVVEDHVLNTGNGLLTRSYLEDLWKMASDRVVSIIRTNTAYCTDANLLLKIKDLIMVFCITLRSYGYSVRSYFDLLHEIQEHYNEILMQKWVQVFRDILYRETFIHLQVENQEEYDNVIKTFPYQDEQLENLQFPRKFPFSSMVPSVYDQVKQFINACLKFSNDLNFSEGEVDEMVQKSTKLLLSRTFSGCLSSAFHQPRLGLLQVIQIIVDMGYLEKSSTSIQKFVSEATGSSGGTVGDDAGISLGVAKSDAEHHMYEKMKLKLNEFLDLEDYDWMLVEPTGQASSFVTDLINFLRVVFNALRSLTEEVSVHVCQVAFEHISKSILNLLLSDDIKQLSMGALNQLNLDVIQCELFAASEPVGKGEDPDFSQYFAPLRQLLDLLLSWDWSTYFHDYDQETSKYAYVKPTTAVIVLEKLKEADKKSVFSVLKKSERDKKKLLDTVLKQLKQLAITVQQ
ncbi:exocyst complex component 6 isoform X1 [Daktulosphaira vitifoliae]|uniref:exocyst complex component 6 isoform X1 n=1 Tax=Daktulosphaira vitifoliae TaxID=58002 RepID=UPI0021AA625D|nr:exocyst complex component 6 isoform X1 [Daktulosphaira vitifoliae]